MLGDSMKDIHIFLGHYGSGKTEVAVNFALHHRVDCIADLDTVNPYFRTNDRRKLLEEAGIQVIAPYFAGSNVDIPALPPEIYSLFTAGKKAVLDVGGDDDGAAVLGRFHDYIVPEKTEVCFVANIFRPETAGVKEILAMIRAVEGASRQKVTALINNANLMQDTTREHIKRGEAVLLEVAGKTGIRFAGNSVMRPLAEDNEFAMDRYITML